MLWVRIPKIVDVRLIKTTHTLFQSRLRIRIRMDPGINLSYWIQIQELQLKVWKIQWKYLSQSSSQLIYFFSLMVMILLKTMKMSKTILNFFCQIAASWAADQEPDLYPIPKPFRNGWYRSSITLLWIGIVLLPIQIRIRLAWKRCRSSCGSCPMF